MQIACVYFVWRKSLIKLSSDWAFLSGLAKVSLTRYQHENLRICCFSNLIISTTIVLEFIVTRPFWQPFSMREISQTMNLMTENIKKILFHIFFAEQAYCKALLLSRVLKEGEK